MGHVLELNLKRNENNYLQVNSLYRPYMIMHGIVINGTKNKDKKPTVKYISNFSLDIGTIGVATLLPFIAASYSSCIDSITVLSSY